MNKLDRFWYKYDMAIITIGLIVFTILLFAIPLWFISKPAGEYGVTCWQYGEKTFEQRLVRNWRWGGWKSIESGNPVYLSSDNCVIERLK